MYEHISAACTGEVPMLISDCAYIIFLWLIYCEGLIPNAFLKECAIQEGLKLNFSEREAIVNGKVGFSSIYKRIFSSVELV